MTWVRKGFVHLFAIVLFFALLGTAVTASLKINFGQPGKLKTCVTQSHIYDHAVSGALDSAQD